MIKIPSFEIDINFKVNTGDLESAQKTLQEVVNTDDPDVDIHANDSEVKTAKKELDDMQGEKVDTEVEVDTSSIKTAKKELEDLQRQLSTNMSSTGNAINGVVGGLAGKGIWDIVYGTSAKAETNKVLIKNMGDVSKSSEDLYNTIDKTTDNSLISMQQLIPALNGIKSATGASASEIDSASTKVASFGQYVYAMTGSEAKAEQAMFDLSKGIKGAYASLDQYGITEDALMRTGLWNGKEDDLNGYLAAVNQVTGSTDELMNTATGMEALMGKSFSRAGKKMGETVLPAVKSLLGGFNDLDVATDGWASTAILIGGSVGSSVVTGLSAVNQAKQGYDALKGSVQTVKDVLSGVRGTIETLKNAESIAAGVTEVLTGAKTLQAAAEEGSMLAKIASIGPTVTLAGAEMGLLLPILLVVGAIIALVAILWYLYNNNEMVRQGIDSLVTQFWGFINTLIVVAQQIYSFVVNAITQVWNWVNGTTNGVNNLVNLVMSILFPFPTLMLTIFNNVLPVIISAVGRWASSAASGASNLINRVSSTLSGMPSRVASAVSGVANAIAKPFQDAYNSVAREVEKIKNKANELSGGLLGGLFGGVEYEGFSTGSVGYEGFSTLNDSYINNTNSNTNSVTNNFNINGIIEESASEYIVGAVNNHIKRQNLIRGV